MTATPDAGSKSKETALVVFKLDDLEFGLHLSAVERVVRLVEITPLPDAPPDVLGVVNVQGDLVPVFDPRLRFHLPPRVPSLNDHLVIAHTAKRKVALVVDTVAGLVEETPDTTVDADNILPHLPSIEGVVKAGDGLILIHNLDKFLSIDEENLLQSALKT